MIVASLTIDFGFQIDSCRNMTFSVFNPFLAISFSYWYPRNTSCIGHFAAKLIFVCVKDGFVFVSFFSAILVVQSLFEHRHLSIK